MRRDGSAPTRETALRATLGPTTPDTSTEPGDSTTPADSTTPDPATAPGDSTTPDPSTGSAEPLRAASAIARLDAFLRREPAFAAAFGVAFVAALLPIWWPRFLPLLDQPNHLASIAIWARLGDPSWHYQDFYAYSRAPVPYWGYYLPVRLFAYVLPVEAANKLYLSLYALAVPLAVLALARRFGRSHWLALLGFPLVFNYNFGWGFISYCAGIPTALFALALLDAFLDEPRWFRLLGVLLLTLATFFMHILPWMALGVCAIPVLLAHARKWPRALAAAGALLATVAIGAADFRFAAANKNLVVPGPIRLTGRWEHAIDSAMELPHRVLMGWPGQGDEAALLLLVLSWFLLATTGRSSTRKSLRDWVPELCFAILTLSYLIVPFRTYRPLDWWNINPRLVAPAALLGILLVRGQIEGRRRWLLLPAMIACLSYPIQLTLQFRQFNSRTEGFVRLMERVPRGSSTLTLLLGGDNDDPAIDHELVPFNEFHSYAQLLAGGYNPFQLKIGFPFREIPGKALPAPFWTRPGEFNQGTMGSHYDYVVTRREAVDKQMFGRWADRVSLVGRDGEWRLYATRGIQ